MVAPVVVSRKLSTTASSDGVMKTIEGKVMAIVILQCDMIFVLTVFFSPQLFESKQIYRRKSAKKNDLPFYRGAVHFVRGAAILHGGVGNFPVT